RQILCIRAQCFKTILLLINNIIHRLGPAILIDNCSLSIFVQKLNAHYDKRFRCNCGKRRKSEVNNPGAFYIVREDAKVCATTHPENTTSDLSAWRHLFLELATFTLGPVRHEFTLLSGKTVYNLSTSKYFILSNERAHFLQTPAFAQHLKIFITSDRNKMGVQEVSLVLLN
ncbi:hypothetical protein BDB00DRAFT_890821, partial [Zychaea mexicana]|uniref:uncharacterized protein n=1 Tax=Zychaea mexicana TaxID=64656 RepID=UPI0022FEDE7B